MRIVAGKFGSRPLATLRGLELRPTSDRLRETLFNILGATIQGTVFVDAYAGSGAVGIEALSRGAGEVFFLEKHPAAADLIRRNLRSLGIAPSGTALRKPPRSIRDTATHADAVESAATRGLNPPEKNERPAPAAAAVAAEAGAPRTEILVADAVAGLRLLHARHVLADFVFLDPPYDEREEYLRALDALADGRLLAPTGRVIVESRRTGRDGIELPVRVGALERARVVKQGDSALTFYRLARAA
jgi:16S rRNA G966 N2-methylase RsmD